MLNQCPFLGSAYAHVCQAEKVLMTAEELVASVVFNSDGLAPAIVQDAQTARC